MKTFAGMFPRFYSYYYDLLSTWTYMTFYKQKYLQVIYIDHRSYHGVKIHPGVWSRMLLLSTPVVCWYYWCWWWVQSASSVCWLSKSPSILLGIPSCAFGPNASTIKSFQYSSVLSSKYIGSVFPVCKSVVLLNCWLLFCWLSMFVWFFLFVFLYSVFFLVMIRYKVFFFFIYYESYGTTDPIQRYTPVLSSGRHRIVL